MVARILVPPRFSKTLAVRGNLIEQVLDPAQQAEVAKANDRYSFALRGRPSYRLLGGQAGLTPGTIALRVSSDDVRDVEHRPTELSFDWLSDEEASPPEQVLASLRGTFSFREEDVAAGVKGLRVPQIGALHSVLGFWRTASPEPATVVMPTGTGKTDAMVAIFAHERIERLLVLVPSDALRNQLATKFLELGVLQQFGIVDASALRPVVGRIQHRFLSEGEIDDFVRRCNVIVSTPDVLNGMGTVLRDHFVAQMSCLFVDEAHHVPADTWSRIRAGFYPKPVLQFTATPYREDDKIVSGRTIYDFPLREAQRLGLFARINYRSVIDFADQDGAIAQAAVDALRADLAPSDRYPLGCDHILMARVSSIRRAETVLKIYERMAADLNPIMLHSQVDPKQREFALEAMRTRTSRIVVCVDMLGEGFDLPALKIAAIHDPHKSIGVTVQFVGRFARSSGERLGEATVVVSRPTGQFDEKLRKLFSEDPDWNNIIRDLSESAIQNQVEVGEFNAAFSQEPPEIGIDSLKPDMSTVVYRVPGGQWDPEKVLDVYPPELLLTYPYSVNRKDGVLWFVTRMPIPVSWGVVNALEDLTHELFLVFFDSETNLLYINSSGNEGHHEGLAKALCGDDVMRITGEEVFRAYANINWIVPTTVGLLDIRNRNRGFIMLNGTNVTDGLTTAEMETKAQTNIFASGFEQGERVTVGVSQKGRVWSYQDAQAVKYWVDWCRAVGAKLIDESVDVEEVMQRFIRPRKIRERPAYVALAAEWPREILDLVSEVVKVEHQGKAVPILDAGLEVRNFNETGPIELRLVTREWSLEYDVIIDDGGMTIAAVGEDARLIRPRWNLGLASYLTETGLNILFAEEGMVTQKSILLKIDRSLPPYPIADASDWPWDGIDLRKESQGPNRDQDSIQWYMSQRIIEQGNWSVVYDDDTAYEIADLVALKLVDRTIYVLLMHCKFAKYGEPRAVIDDLYEVCGQAMKSVRWKSNPRDMIENLIRREKKRLSDGKLSGFIVGNAHDLLAIEDALKESKTSFTISIAQPGLSKSRVSAEQLRLLASTESYVRQITNGGFEVHCSG
jgi:superfamily II DNA or RNA helicase